MQIYTFCLKSQPQVYLLHIHFVFAFRGYSGECHILTHSMVRNLEINNTARKLRNKFSYKYILLNTSKLFLQFDIFDKLYYLKSTTSFAIYRSPNAVIRLKYCVEQITQKQ